MKNLTLLFVSALCINNLILTRFLGVCTLFSNTAALRPIFKTGIAMTIAMIISSWLCWVSYNLVLAPLYLVHLKLPVCVLVTALWITALVFYLKEKQPELHRMIAASLSIFTAHCSVLGVILIVIETKYNLLESTVFAVGSGIGGLVVMLAFAAIKEGIALAPISESFEGSAIDLIGLGLIALAFFGFSGLLGLS